MEGILFLHASGFSGGLAVFIFFFFFSSWSAPDSEWASKSFAHSEGASVLLFTFSLSLCFKGECSLIGGITSALECYCRAVPALHSLSDYCTQECVLPTCCTHLHTFFFFSNQQIIGFSLLSMKYTVIPIISAGYHTPALTAVSLWNQRM